MPNDGNTNARRRSGNGCKIETSIRKIMNRKRQEKFSLDNSHINSVKSGNNYQVPSLFVNKCLSDDSLLLSDSADSLTSIVNLTPKFVNSKQVVEITGIHSPFTKKIRGNSELSRGSKINGSRSNCNLTFKYLNSRWKSCPHIFYNEAVRESALNSPESLESLRTPLVGVKDENVPIIVSSCSLKKKIEEELLEDSEDIKNLRESFLQNEKSEARTEPEILPKEVEEQKDLKNDKNDESQRILDNQVTGGKTKLEEFCRRHLERTRRCEETSSDDSQPKKNHLILKTVTIDELQKKFHDIRMRLDKPNCDYVINEDLRRKFMKCPCKMKSTRPRRVNFHVPPEKLSPPDFSKKKLQTSRYVSIPRREIINECEHEYFCKEIVSVRKNLKAIRNSCKNDQRHLSSKVSSIKANREDLIFKTDEDWEINGQIYDDPRGIMFPKETQNNCPTETRTTDPKSILRLRAGGRGGKEGDIMQTNGTEGVSENGVDRTGWTVGLINGKFKYLTAETFGFKINANGSSLKKKQLWTLEGSEHQVYLRSHLDRYLAVDQFGNVTCEAEDSSDPGCAFQIQLASDGSGRWALKNIQRGYFLGSSQDELKCTAKAPGEAEYWLVHLAARPQVNLRSAGRKRFAHLSATQDEIHVDAPVPWGEDTLFTLEFRPAANPDNDPVGHGKSEGGHYALHTCNNKYLARDGKLLDTCTRDCLYAAEFHAGLLSLRDIHGAYLAPIGSKAVLKSRSTTVTRDELFSLEESLPQASFVAALNQRYVSVKQGVDVTANQDEISGHETFQLEFDRVTKRWYVRTMQDRYWTLEAGGGIQASDHKRSSNALFDLVWQPEDGTVALRANNGKFLGTKRSGHLYANTDSPTSGDSDASKYYFYLMNRPILVLRCEQGFVGAKSAASPKLECNKAGYETIRVERCDRGIVRFKGQNGKYWNADSEGVTVDADQPSVGFYLELREPSRICIKCTDGRYLSAGKNGALRLGETDYESATKWEF